MAKDTSYHDDLPAQREGATTRVGSRRKGTVHPAQLAAFAVDSSGTVVVIEENFEASRLSTSIAGDRAAAAKTEKTRKSKKRRRKKDKKAARDKKAEKRRQKRREKKHLAEVAAQQPPTPPGAQRLQGPVVETTLGKAEGIVLMGVRTWRGLPFGADTGGHQRFRAPHPADGWSGVREAQRYGQVATQPTYGLNDAIRGGEDCLNLDVVRPDTDEVLPVVVYFHGGSFIYGSSHEQLLRGHYLAESMNVVYVSINFRLGALGYLDMRTFGDDCVANPAVLDQVLALRWVRKNIAAFGGDPGNVTVMGESAGGAAVLTLMCVPAAKGLFHKAIAQSPPIATIHSQAQSTFWAQQIAARLELDSACTLRDFRALAAPEVVRAGQSMLWRTRELLHLNSCYAPTVDKRTLFGHPLDVFEAGQQHKVPLLVGTNFDEASFAKGFYLRQTARARAADRMLTAFDPHGAPGVLQAYGGAEQRGDFASLLTDAVFWAPTMSAANAHAKVAETWMYRFDFAPSILKWMGLGAMHSMELTPVFGDLNASRMSSLNRFGAKDELVALRDLMQYHWSHFIHHGNPGENWPRYVTPSDHHPGRATKVFDRTSQIVYDPHRHRRRAWRNYNMREWGTGRPELLAELGLMGEL